MGLNLLFDVPADIRENDGDRLIHAGIEAACGDLLHGRLPLRGTADALLARCVPEKPVSLFALRTDRESAVPGGRYRLTKANRDISAAARSLEEWVGVDELLNLGALAPIRRGGCMESLRPFPEAEAPKGSGAC